MLLSLILNKGFCQVKSAVLRSEVRVTKFVVTTVRKQGPVNIRAEPRSTADKQELATWRKTNFFASDCSLGISRSRRLAVVQANYTRL